MAKRLIDIIKDDFGRIFRTEPQWGFISGEGKVICSFHFLNFTHVVGVEEREDRLESTNLEAKDVVFRN